jgi:biotin carboxyl carrier protein
MRYITVVGERAYTIDIDREGEVVIDGEVRPLDMRAIGQEGLYSLLVRDESFEALVEESEDGYHVLIDGTLYQARVVDERAKRLAEAAGAFTVAAGELTVKSPMPGLIVSLPVQPGDTVRKGQVVAVLESMKMENELKAPRDGKVVAVKVEPRQAVEQNQVLLVIE